MAEYSTLEFLKGLDESKMTVSAQLVRDAMLEGNYPGQSKQLVDEASADIVSIEVVQEPHGRGVLVKQADGHEYRYAADDTNPKYNTPEKLAAAANKILKFRKSGPTFGWLRQNAILYSGSKREAAKAKEEESLSKEAEQELLDLIRSLHDEYSDEEVREAMEAFLEDLGIDSDQEFYRIGPAKLKKLLA